MNNRSIAFVHERFPDGGASTVTSLAARHLTESGYTVYIFAHEINKLQLMSNHAQVTFIKLPDSTANTKANADLLIREINKLKISFLLSLFLTDQLSYIKSKTSCRILFTDHYMPLWEVSLRFSLGEKAAQKSILKAAEWYLIRQPKYKLFNKPYKQAKEKYKKIYDAVDGYTVLCDEYGKTIAQIVDADYANSKIFTLTNPTIRLSDEINLNKKKQVIFTGRLQYADKRVDRLLDIWKMIYTKFPDWELLIVGDGSDREELEKYAAKLGLKNYRFCGYAKNIADYLQTASILCLTSTFEGWGLSLTEAQLYGVIPMAFGCSEGVKTVLSPSGVNGIVIPPFDMEEYAAKLSELMGNDALRARMQANVIEKAKEYNIENVGKQWDKMLTKLTE